MNKKAIAGILARLDDPDMIETVLDLIGNQQNTPEPQPEPQKRKYYVNKTSKKWSRREHRDLEIAINQLWGERSEVSVRAWWDMVADFHGHGRSGDSCRQYAKRHLHVNVRLAS